MTDPDDAGDGDDGDLIDRIDRGIPAETPEEAEAREPYERLFAQIRELEDIPPPSGWEERAHSHYRASRAQQRRRRMVLAAIIVSAAMAGAIAYAVM